MAAMPIPINEQKEALAPLLPVCPHCGQDPALLSGLITKLGGNLVLVIFCENIACRKIHSCIPVGAQPQRPSGPNPGLWLPT